MNPETHILILTNRYPDDHKPYAAWYIRAHSQWMREAGFRVDILSPGSGHGSSLRRLLNQASCFLRVSAILIRSKPDLVHAHWILPSGLYGLLFHLCRKIPFVLTSHGALIEEFDSLAFITKHLVRWTLRSADVIIAVGSLHAQKIRVVMGENCSRIETVSMGIIIPPEEPQRKVPTEMASIPSPRIVFLGNLIPVKGPDLAIRALGILIERGMIPSLTIIGQGGMKDDLHRLVANLNLDGHVYFLGPVVPERVADYLSAADVCVIPSRREPFGLVAMESMACGKPVIAADVGGLRENISDQETGLLFRAGDANALADSIKTVLEDNRLAQQLGKKGRLAAESHDMELRVRDVMKIYRSLAAVSS
jgi:glycosyltransferase involved in cell wall biosynthesis